METLGDSVEALRAVWAGALPAYGPVVGRATPGGGAQAALDAQLRSMSDAGLLRTTDAMGQLHRSVDALMAALAGEIARRSPQDAGKDGLAKKQGFRNTTQLVADATGGAFAGAAKLVAIGRVTANRTSLTGELLPPQHPHVAAALRSGSVSVDAAGAITGMLDRVSPRVNPDDADRVERLLAERAAGLPLDLLGRAIAEVEARLDPDGVKPREDELRAARSLTLRQDGHGMLRISGALDPETGAPVMAAIQGIVSHALRAARDHGEGAASTAAGNTASAADAPTRGSAVGTVLPDGRTIPQLQADALGAICRHAIGCDQLPDAPSTAVVVRIQLDTLTGGIGPAQIDGIAQPVSAGTARRMAAAAGIIPLVLGTDSLPLDVGRARRGFTPAQKIALAERDGGCACCGLDVPYTEAHHIKWWVRDNGRTDLTNGVLLCQACHCRIHNDGWTITANRTSVWFTPPPHVDPDQKPRLGGKARFRLAYEPSPHRPGRPPDGAVGASSAIECESAAVRGAAVEAEGVGGAEPAASSASTGEGRALRPSRTENSRPHGRSRSPVRPPGAPAPQTDTRRRSRVEFRE